MADTIAEQMRPGTTQETRDWRWLALCITSVLMITWVPYLYGYYSAPTDRVFQGIIFNVPDIAQYWSWMRDHRTGLFVPNRMTPEPNEPALFNSLWLVLSQLQRATGWSEAIIYQVLRLVGGGAFLITLWWFTGLFALDRGQRWTAYLVALLGGGFGWIWVVDKYLWAGDVRYPLDLYVVEPNSFFALMTLPHLIVAAAMILAIFGSFLRAVQQNDDIRWYGVGAVVALLLGLSHTYDLIMIYSVLGAFVLLRCVQQHRILWRCIGGLVLVGGLSFPPAGYFAYLTSQNPLWRQVLEQFDNAGIFTPDLLHLPLLLGLPFVITVIDGIRSLAQRIANRSLSVEVGALPITFLWVWVVVGFGLLYIPTDYQIKMLNPYQVPLAILATRAVWRLGQHRKWKPIVLTLALVGLTIPTNLYLFSWRILELSRAEAPFYLTQDEVAVLDWLDARSEERAVVLSGLNLGQYVPALTGQRAFLAHWAQTVDFFEKRTMAQRFFDGTIPATERTAIVDRFQLRYVLFGAEERTFGQYDPATDPGLRVAYKTTTTIVYEVVRAQSTTGRRLAHQRGMVR